MKKASLAGNMLIAQSGGPSMVINESLVGAVLEARRYRPIRRVYGALHGIKGILAEQLIDLGREPVAVLERVARTPSSALGSVRKKPTPEDCRQIFAVLKRYDVRYFFYIGGNDSAETAHILHANARGEGYEFRCFHIPKTIDNDLRQNDHTPGYGSAARFVACAVAGDDLDNRALPGVKIDVIMGRHAGFLTAASALARVRPDDGPHLIYLPERPFSLERFTADVQAVYQKLGRCVVAVSEGVVDEHGEAIASKFIKEVDAHGNVQLSGTGALGDLLAAELKARAKISRVRADTFGYLQRSFPFLRSETDAREARQVGRAAVREALAGRASGSIAIRRQAGRRYRVELRCVPLDQVARETRAMPSKFINRAGNDVTQAFLDYARPLVGPLPAIGHLRRVPVAPPSAAPSPAAASAGIRPCRPKWKGTMTDRERFNNQMHYRPVDRCFNMEFGYWQENFEQWPLFLRNGIRTNEQADVFFNFDRIQGVGGVVWMNPPFPREVIEETAATRILRNADGLLAEVPRDGHDTIPHFLKASIVTPEDWRRCKAERFRRDDPARRVDVAGLKRRHPPGRAYPLGVGCGSMIGKVRDMLTFEGLAYACYDYPEMVEDMVETCCVLVEDFLDQVLPHLDFDFATGWEDICFKNGPIISLDFFTRVVVPRYRRIGRKLHAAGIDLWYTDCDGDVRPLIPGFLEAGINCLFPYEVNSCVHPAELLGQYGKDLRLMGGVDKMQLKKGPAAIKACLESLAPLVARGGYIPFCDHRCPPDVSPDDYLYYLDLKERMFGMR
jgi:uroporphyrinogen decarboxylase